MQYSDECARLSARHQQDLHDFIRFFDGSAHAAGGGVDHANGGFCCGLAHTGQRLTDRKFIWFNGRGVWTYATTARTGLLNGVSPPPGAPSPDDSMHGYLVDVALKGARFALAHGQDASGG